MAKFTWQDGTLVSKAKVEIGGTIYEVDPEEYSGATPLSASNLNAMQDGIYEDIEEVDNKILEIGKRLWTGNFSTGSITVSGISNYTMIAINVGGVLCIGNQRYGGCVFTRYGNFDTTSYGYRYTYDSTNETLTVDNEQTGATDGTNRQAITEIYGIF